MIELVLRNRLMLRNGHQLPEYRDIFVKNRWCLDMMDPGAGSLEDPGLVVPGDWVRVMGPGAGRAWENSEADSRV